MALIYDEFYFHCFHQILAIFAVIAFANAQIRPILRTRDGDAVILKQIYEPNPDGSYVYRWVNWAEYFYALLVKDFFRNFLIN